MGATALDDRATVERLDPQGLLARIEALPEQCEEAWQLASQLELPAGYADVREVVVLGMGGSAIAGDILRSLAGPAGRKPVHIVRGYDLPAFIGPDALVLACSHSGNTEETLSAFEQALSKGALCAAIATGGRIEALARERSVTLFGYDYDGEPRSALGHQLMLLAALGERAGLLEAQAPAVREAVEVMRRQREAIGFASPAERNPAKQIASRLHGKLPVVIGAGVLGEAAHRWKTQLNENSSSWAVWEELPELDHNSVVGFGLPKDVAARVHAVFLSHPGLHPRVLLRYDATADELDLAGVSHERVEALGESTLAQVLSAIYLGDLTSYYLALLYGVEPSTVEPLVRLKEKLAGR